MTREEAIETLGHVVPFATQNGEKIAEAIDIAIEALTFEEYGLTCKTCADRNMCIMSAPDGQWKACEDYRPSEERLYTHEEAWGMTDYISRADAINAVGEAIADGRQWYGALLMVPSARPTEKEQNDVCSCSDSNHVIKFLGNNSISHDTIDCTKFMEWLKAEVLDEENWELNAIANGEIICRKFKKLGWLDVKDGFYVDARPTGEWIKHEIEDTCRWVECSECHKEYPNIEMNFCSNCGARMTPYREDGEA